MGGASSSLSRAPRRKIIRYHHRKDDIENIMTAAAKALNGVEKSAVRPPTTRQKQPGARSATTDSEKDFDALLNELSFSLKRKDTAIPMSARVSFATNR